MCVCRGACEQALDQIEYLYGLSSEQQTEVDTVKVAILLNQALCQNKSDRWSDAIKTCEKVLKLEPTNVKALFRRGQAYHRSSEFEKATADFQAVLQHDPSNADARTQLAAVQKSVADHKAKEKRMFAGLFSK